MSIKSPYEDITPETIKADMLAGLEGKMSIGEGSYANILVSEAAWQLYRAYQQVPHLLAMAFPGPDAGPYLDLAAGVVGMTREQGAKASVVITFTGRAGTRLAAGTAVYAPDSGLQYLLTADVTLSGGTGTGRAEAQETGSVYNLPAGAITALETGVAGVDSLTNEAAAAGGADPESDEAFYNRWHQRMSQPAASGNPAQYIQWALEVPGVAAAGCEPLWNGAGSVRVIVGGPGRSPVDAGGLKRCEAHIQENRPIGAKVTVDTCHEIPLSLTATVTTAKGYTKEDVKSQLTERVTAMLAALPFGVRNDVPHSRFLACLLDCPGVADYSRFEVVDWGTDTVILMSMESPRVGTVTVS